MVSYGCVLLLPPAGFSANARAVTSDLLYVQYIYRYIEVCVEMHDISPSVVLLESTSKKDVVQLPVQLKFILVLLVRVETQSL